MIKQNKLNSFWQPVKPNKNIKPTRLFGFDMNVSPRPNFDIKPRAPVTPVNLKSYPVRTKMETKLIDRNPWGDKDKDKVPNYFDCKPLDKKKQGFYSIFNDKRAQFYPYAKKRDKPEMPPSYVSKMERKPSLEEKYEQKIKEGESIHPHIKSSRERIVKILPDRRRKDKPDIGIGVEGKKVDVKLRDWVESHYDINNKNLEEKDKKRIKRTTEQIIEQKKEDKFYNKWYKKYREKITQLEKEGKIPKISKIKTRAIKKSIKSSIVTTLPGTETEPTEEDVFYKEIAQKALEQQPVAIKSIEEPVSEEKAKQREYIRSLLGRNSKWDKMGGIFPREKKESISSEAQIKAEDKRLTEQAQIKKDDEEIRKRIKEDDWIKTLADKKSLGFIRDKRGKWTPYGWQATKEELKDSYEKLRDAGATVEMAQRVKGFRPSKLKYIIEKKPKHSLFKMYKERQKERIEKTGFKSPAYKLEEVRESKARIPIKKYEAKMLDEKIKEYIDESPQRQKIFERMQKPGVIKKLKDIGIAGKIKNEITEYNKEKKGFMKQLMGDKRAKGFPHKKIKKKIMFEGEEMTPENVFNDEELKEIEERRMLNNLPPKLKIKMETVKDIISKETGVSKDKFTNFNAKKYMDIPKFTLNKEESEGYREFLKDFEEKELKEKPMKRRPVSMVFRGNKVKIEEIGKDGRAVIIDLPKKEKEKDWPLSEEDMEDAMKEAEDITYEEPMGSAQDLIDKSETFSDEDFKDSASAMGYESKKEKEESKYEKTAQELIDES